MGIAYFELFLERFQSEQCGYFYPGKEHFRNMVSNPKTGLFTKVIQKRLFTVSAQELNAEVSNAGRSSQSEENAPTLKNPMPQLCFPDKTSLETYLTLDEVVERHMQTETGASRLNHMYSTDESLGGRVSPELSNVINQVKHVMLGTFLITSYIGFRNARDEFIRTHQHTKWPTKFKAMRSMNDAVLLDMIKYSTRLTFKAGLLVTIYMTVSESIAVYRNKTSITEYIVAGAASGSLLRINYGLRGITAGFIMGTVLGLLSGAFIYGTLRANEDTQEQRHYWTTQARLRNFKFFNKDKASEILST